MLTQIKRKTKQRPTKGKSKIYMNNKVYLLLIFNIIEQNKIEKEKAYTMKDINELKCHRS